MAPAAPIEQTIENLTQELAALQAKLDAAKQQKRGGVIEDIRKSIALYDILPKELFSSDGQNVKQKAQRKSAVAKYQNPENPAQTWAGRGRSPKWMTGRSHEEFLIAK